MTYAGLPRAGENIWKMKYFPGQGKVREFCGWPGKYRKDLESQGKVREFEKNGYGRQSSENLFCSRGERVYFHWGLLLKERICSLGEQILSFRVPSNLK